MGYHRAGFAVEGVDLFIDYTQARYPFPSRRADILHTLRTRGHEYDAHHVSPPCQRHTAGTRAVDRSAYPDLIGPVREALIATGRPYVIENVVGAPLDGVTLCGCMFGLSAVDTDGIRLNMLRPRVFETNFPVPQPEHDAAFHAHEWIGGSYGGARRDKYEAKYVRGGGYVPSIPVQRQLLGIGWMTQRGMFQSVPPVYTEYIGKYLMEAVNA